MEQYSGLYTYFGHHKCATQWISAILKGACDDLGLNFAKAFNQKLKTSKQDLSAFVKENKIDFLGYTTAAPHYVAQVDDYKGFHVIRDPRDICVSAYFSHLHSHPVRDYMPEIAAARKELKGLSQDEGLLFVIKGRQLQFEIMYDWDYSRPNILEIKMENLTVNPYQGFLTIFDFLGLLDKTTFSFRRRLFYPVSSVANSAVVKARRKVQILPRLRLGGSKISAESLLGQVYKHQFSQKAQGRQPGEENVHNHYRKGIAGDWVNHFSKEHSAYFKEHYNKVLVKLGYESGSDW